MSKKRKGIFSIPNLAMGAAAMAAIYVLTGSSARAGYTSYTNEQHVKNFIAFLVAQDGCPGIYIKVKQTQDQLADYAVPLYRERDPQLTELSRIEEQAAYQMEHNTRSFCEETRRIYRSYDPDYLRRVGMI